MSKIRNIVCLPWVILFRLFLGVTFFLVLCVTWPIFLFRYLLSVLAPIFRPELGLMLTPRSRFFLPVSNPRFNMLIQFKLRGKLDYPLLAKRFTENCILLRDQETGKVKFPEFQQYYTTWLGYPFWKNEENFQIKQHVRHLVLESEKDIEEEFNRTIEKAFPAEKSPWEGTIVETRDDPNCHYLWFKFHHSLSDGDSMAKAMMCAADSEPQRLQRGMEPPSSFWTQCLRVLNFVMAYFRLLDRIFRPAPLPWDSRDMTPASFKTSIDSIPLSHIRCLSQKFGVSVSAVLICIVTGAIRRKFLAEGVSELPSNLRGSTPIPLPHPGNNLINKYLFFEFTHPIQKAELFERLTDIEMQMQRERQMRSSLVLYFMILLMGSLPLFIHISPTSVICNPLTIFPGPTAPVSFAGSIVDDITFTLNMSTQSVFTLLVTVLSYAGKLRFVINANGKICPTQNAVEEFSEYIMDELEEMDSSPPSRKVEQSV